MRINHILLIIAAFVVSACKKGEEQPDKEVTPIYLVSKITRAPVKSGEDNEVQEFIYDNKNRIIQTHFYYTGPIPVYDSDQTYKYSFDDKDRVIRADRVDANNKVISARKFIYTTGHPKGDPEYRTVEGDIDVVVYPVNLDDHGRVQHIVGIQSAYDNDGHLIYASGDAPDDVIKNFANRYDDKQNPFSNVIGLNPNIDYISQPNPQQTLNNVISLSSLYFIEYSYNKHGFPEEGRISGGVYASKVFNVITYDYITR